MTKQLAFHNTQFNVVTHKNQIWLSSKELAKALEYATDNAVTMLYNKNADEFTDVMTEVVESTTSGNYRKKVRIFSLRGAHLIAMFARTPVAKEFRRWVLDVLDREVGDPVAQPASSTPSTLCRSTEVHAFCDDYASRTELIYYHDFKPIFCRVLRSDEIVATPESIKEWMEMRGLILFTREELKNMTYGQWLALVE
ncbi:BRO-N domain-containing protein [Lelliottia wanjuensis]|uniref:BRO-N domain-containing protein n=1 Tax=Lelliottia wanjuensis TaxID=3050585 RepID=UPI00254D1A72|nr:BRO family protein [Lelliottia sp. V106_16]MDK9356739.1 BRO family protein [Lelliottia sp. V106_16]